MLEGTLPGESGVGELPSADDGPGGGPPRTGEASVRVLIVDDSSVIRQRLLALLNPLSGVTVVGQATTPEDGLELTRTLAPTVVTLDINLKGGSGLDLLREIKTLPSPPLVIVLTNYPYPAFRSRSSELGAEHFLTKSREFHQIQMILEDLVLGSGDLRKEERP